MECLSYVIEFIEMELGGDGGITTTGFGCTIFSVIGSGISSGGLPAQFQRTPTTKSNKRP
tara:strand:- start:350 stop:529 length:180 start_codon:yes stop_codon:yes gene_type:complete